jgi:hypothetical protein
MTVAKYDVSMKRLVRACRSKHPELYRAMKDAVSEIASGKWKADKATNSGAFSSQDKIFMNMAKRLAYFENEEKMRSKK